MEKMGMQRMQKISFLGFTLAESLAWARRSWVPEVCGVWERGDGFVPYMFFLDVADAVHAIAASADEPWRVLRQAPFHSFLSFSHSPCSLFFECSRPYCCAEHYAATSTTMTTNVAKAWVPTKLSPVDLRILGLFFGELHKGPI